MRRAALVLLAVLPSLAFADSKVAPGAYCPLPQGDEPPACLQPATRDYATFFRGLQEGRVDEVGLAEVEGDLTSEDRYQALSALVYAYYLLSQRAAVGGPADPQLAGRLEHWNQLLGDSYRASSDEQFRLALRQAVGDLERRAPPIPVRCRDAEGNITHCQSTAAVAEAITDVRDRTGIRGAVGRLLNRLLGGAN